MKLIITILLSILIVQSYSKELDFAPQRMNTDFRGVEAKDNTILCYGDFGIITYSEDLGQTWKQLNLGDKHNIMKIIAKDGVFYAVSEFSLFKSSDGINWNEKEFSEDPMIISMAMSKDELFILSKEALYKSDFNLNFEKLVDLEPNVDRTEIQTDSSSIYIIENNEYITRCNKESKLIDTIKVIEHTAIYSIAKLEIYDNALYYTIFPSNLEEMGNYRFNIGKTEKQGENSIVSSYLQSTLYFNLHKDKFYFANTNYNVFQNESSDIQFWQVDTDTTNILINNDDKSEYYLRGNNDVFIYNEIKWINDETVIAVGDNKLINISYDGGKNWEIKSFMRSSIASFSQITPVGLSKDSIFSPRGLVGNFKTTNGGITWLTAKYSDKYFGENKVYGSIKFFSIKKDGSIFLLSSQSSVKSYDFGNDYELFDEGFPFRFTMLGDRKGIEIGENTLFKSWSYQGTGSNIYIYNNDFNLMDSVLIDSTKLSNLVKVDNTIYTVGFRELEYNEELEQYTKFESVILNSTDNGYTWNELPTKAPWNVSQYEVGDKTYFATLVEDIYFHENKIVIPHRFRNSKMFYYYDLSSSTFDSLDAPFEIKENNSFKDLFSFNEHLCYFGTNDTLYYTSNFGNNATWDSVDIRGMLRNQRGNSGNFGFNRIISAWADSSQIYLATGRRIDEVYQINIVKLLKEDIPSSVEYTENIENQKVYLYNKDPYPIPGKTKINTKIYWNSFYNINDAEIKVYDSNAQEIENPVFTFGESNQYSAVLTWHCESQKPGIYFIYIKLNDETKSIPVIIIR